MGFPFQPLLSGGAQLLSGGAPVSHDATGALEGQGAVVAGSAARFRAHPSSGALAGQDAIVAGAANRFRAHPSSGVLEGPGSVIDGDANRFRAHPSTGALEGPGADLSGDANRFRAFSSSGALSGQGAEISGSAARTGSATEHAATGELFGQGSILDGSATHETTQPPIGGGYVDNEYWDRVRKEREEALDAIIRREFEKTVVTPSVTTAKAAKKFKRFVLPDRPKVDFKAIERETEKNRALLKAYKELVALINLQISAELEAERLRLMALEEEEFLLLMVALRRRGRLNIH